MNTMLELLDGELISVTQDFETVRQEMIRARLCGREPLTFTDPVDGSPIGIPFNMVKTFMPEPPEARAENVWGPYSDVASRQWRLA